MLLVFLQTVHKDRPNWSRQDSLLKMNPGLSFRPRIPFDKADSSILIYKLNDSNSFQNWVDDLDEFLKVYEKKETELKECLRSNLRDSKTECPFLPNLKQNENPCRKEIDNYGYSKGEPCFLIKLNKVKKFFDLI